VLDLALAIVPWIILNGVQINQKEQIFIKSSMSLGVL